VLGGGGKWRGGVRNDYLIYTESLSRLAMSNSIRKKKTFVASDVGVPQGGLISPLLSNLVLHELDLYMERRIRERELLSQGASPTVSNPAYRKINNLVRRCAEKKDRSELRIALRLRRRTRATFPNPQHSMLKYVRYADDWLVGVWGTKRLALELKSDIKTFLQSLKLTLFSPLTQPTQFIIL